MNKYIKSFDGNKLHYRYNVINKKKQTIVFLHGVTANYSLWQYVYSRLEQDGFNTLTMDLRGHGKSEGRNVNILNMVKDIELIIIKENVRNVVLVGNCLGANLGFHVNKILNDRIYANYLINPVAKNVLGVSIIPLIVKMLYNIFKIFPKRKNHTFEDYSEYYKLHGIYHWLPLKNMKAINWHNHVGIIYDMLNTNINFNNINKRTRIIFTPKDAGLVSLKKLRQNKNINIEISIFKQHHFIVTKKPDVVYKDLSEFLKC